MATHHPSDDTRHPERDTAAERQLQADTEENRRQAERLEATAPPPVDEKTIEEIADRAERRAKP